MIFTFVFLYLKRVYQQNIFHLSIQIEYAEVIIFFEYLQNPQQSKNFDNGFN